MKKLNELLELWSLTIDENNNMVHLAHSTKDLEIDDYIEVGFQASYNVIKERLEIEYVSDTMSITTHEKWSLSDFIKYLQDSNTYDWEDIFDDMYYQRSISDMEELFSDPKAYCDEYFKDDKNFLKVDIANW